MNRLFLLALIGTFFILPTGNGAASAPPDEAPFSVPLRLSEAVNAAICNNLELRMELEREGAARSKVRESRGSFLPTVDLTASTYYLLNFDKFAGVDITARINGNDVSVRVEKDVPPFQWDAEASLRYNLYAGGRDTALLNEARSNLEAARFRRKVALKKVQLDVSKAYWELKKAQLLRKVAVRGGDVTRLEAKISEVQHRIGRSSDIERDTVALKRTEKEVALKVADRNLRRAFVEYLHVLGTTETAIAPSSNEIPALLDDLPDENEVIDDASGPPETLLLASEIDAAQERKKSVQSERYPKVDFFMDFSLVGRDSESWFGVWGDTTADNYTVGLQVTFNAFDGWRTKERIVQADAETGLKRLRLQQKEREIAQARRSMKAALEKARDELALARARESLERARERVAKADLDSGRISELEYRQNSANAEDATDRVYVAQIEVAQAQNGLKLLVLE